MTPAEDAAVAEIEAEYITLAARGAVNIYGKHGARIPFLIALARRLQKQIDDLKAGGTDPVLSAKDVEIAARESQLAAQAAQIAELEAIKLPPPDVFFRTTEPKGVDFPSKNLATGEPPDQDIAIVSST